MRTLKINGEERKISAETIAALLEMLELPMVGIAVELNGEIVKGESYKSAALNDGDVLEIVSLVGGG